MDQFNAEQNIGDESRERKTEQGFTPGEWKVKESRIPGYSRTIDVVAGDLLICEVTGGGASNPAVLAQVRANARLLAASKALYGAANAALEAERCPQPYCGDEGMYPRQLDYEGIHVEPEQCEFCATNPRSFFRAKHALRTALALVDAPESLSINNQVNDGQAS